MSEQSIINHLQIEVNLLQQYVLDLIPIEGRFPGAVAQFYENWYEENEFNGTNRCYTSFFAQYEFTIDGERLLADNGYDCWVYQSSAKMWLYTIDGMTFAEEDDIDESPESVDEGDE